MPPTSVLKWHCLGNKKKKKKKNNDRMKQEKLEEPFSFTPGLKLYGFLIGIQ